MKLQRRVCLGVAIALLGLAMRPVVGVGLAAQESAVLLELLARTNFIWDKGVHCLDPNMLPIYNLRDTTKKPSTPWRQVVVDELLRDSSIAIDTAAGKAPRGARLCTRSQTMSRLAFSNPRISGDTVSVIAVSSRLDSRNLPDTISAQLRFVRRDGVWRNSTIMMNSMLPRIYIRGDGCFRLTHPLFNSYLSVLRVDTILIRADSVHAGESLTGLPAHPLRPGTAAVGLGYPDPGILPYWYASRDTLHLIWGIFDQTLSVHAQMIGDSLHGILVLETDARRPNPPQVPVVGHRVACPP